MSGIHSQNTPIFGGGLNAADSDGRGGEGEFFSDEITLGQGPIGVEVGVVAVATWVTGSGKGKIGNSRFAERAVTWEERESGGERRVKPLNSGFN